jgi:DNA sulfur modification protein DndC
MKIQPTSEYVKKYVSAAGQVIMLLGVRRSESGARAASAKRYGSERLNAHNDLAGCLVFRPILEFTTEEVWETLGACRAPWGGNYQDLINLYRNADGGECPVVTQKSDVPSCGTSSSRFGCWTCTVVEKDKSLEGFVDAGFGEFIPLLRFREWLLEIRDDPERRDARRRDGRFTLMANGSLIPGPFVLSTRREILTELLALQESTGKVLIHPKEIARIRSIWAEDAARGAQRVAESNAQQLEGGKCPMNRW